jgi:hypothetical protein
VYGISGFERDVAIVLKSGMEKEETQIRNTDTATIPKLKKNTKISKIIFLLPPRL